MGRNWIENKWTLKNYSPYSIKQKNNNYKNNCISAAKAFYNCFFVIFLDKDFTTAIFT